MLLVIREVQRKGERAPRRATPRVCKREFVQASNCNLFKGNSSFGPVRLPSLRLSRLSVEFGGEKGLSRGRDVEGMTGGNPGFDLQWARR